MLRVPGPTALDENWRWRADAVGAPQSDARADQHVHSFWAVRYNDDQVTRNALFTWAPWPVAMAFGARATARSRGLVLNVRQRPSHTAGVDRHELRLPTWRMTSCGAGTSRRSARPLPGTRSPP